MRARMLAALIFTITSVVVGCHFEGLGAWGRRETAPVAQTPTTPPQTFVAAQSQPQTDPGQAGADVTPLARRVQNYVGQFPPDDLDRRSVAGPQLQPITPQAAASPAPAAVPPPGPTIPLQEPVGQQPMANAAPPPLAARPATANAPAVQPLTPVQPAPGQTNPIAPPVAQPPATPRVELSDVRPAANAPTAAPPTEPLAAPNQPIAARSDRPADSLAGLIQQLEQQVSANPRQLDDQLRLRLLYMATGAEEKAAGAIQGVDPVQSDMLAAVFRVLAGVRKAISNPIEGGPPAVAALDELRRIVGQQTPVMVTRMALVTRVNSFGDYEAVQPPKFRTGQPVHVFLYTEIANFRSEPTPENRLRTLLSEKVEIFDASGKIIWQRAEPQIEDRALSPRRDFFMTMEIQLPETTPAGEYILKVTVEDKLASTTDQQRLTFSIAAP